MYIQSYMVSTPKSAPATAGRITWQCACFNTRKAARAVTRFYDDMLEPSGLTATQLTMLGAISISGPARISLLAELLVLDKTTLTRNLKLLETAAMVTIAAGEDRRERIVALTPQGAEAVERALPHWRAAQRRIVEHLGEARWHRLVDDLSDLEGIVSRPGSPTRAN